MSIARVLRVLIVPCVAGYASAANPGIVIRHDRPDSLYLALGA